MKIHFVDRHESLIKEIERLYSFPEQNRDSLTEPWNFEATFECGDIFTASPLVDCVGFVSPANSIGAMDGGIDRYYTSLWGDMLPQMLVNKIKKSTWYDELLVGDAVSINVADLGGWSEASEQTCPSQIEWMIAAPTMRTPQRLADNLPAFLATRAAVGLALREGYIDTLLIPGMGSGIGGLHPHEAASAMLCGAHAATKYSHSYLEWVG